MPKKTQQQLEQFQRDAKDVWEKNKLRIENANQMVEIAYDLEALDRQKNPPSPVPSVMRDEDKNTIHVLKCASSYAVIFVPADPKIPTDPKLPITFAFPGTNDWGDVAKDFTISPNIRSLVSNLLKSDTIRNPKRVITHGGVDDALRERIVDNADPNLNGQELLDVVKQFIQKYPDRQIDFTGHSLGGAMAIVATEILANDKTLVPRLRLITSSPASITGIPVTFDLNKKLRQEQMMHMIPDGDIVPHVGTGTLPGYCFVIKGANKDQQILVAETRGPEGAFARLLKNTFYRPFATKLRDIIPNHSLNNTNAIIHRMIDNSPKFKLERLPPPEPEFLNSVEMPNAPQLQRIPPVVAAEEIPELQCLPVAEAPSAQTLKPLPIGPPTQPQRPRPASAPRGH